jgi:SAM-dependent methyltransferase
MNPDSVRTAVRERYARIVIGPARTDASSGHDACCGPSCCATETAPPDAAAAAEPAAGCCVSAVPLTFSDGRPLPPDIASGSLGCGAPLEAAAPRPGEVIVDLGSGTGLDVLFAADRAGPAGRAIGVDMTPEMIAKARANAARLGITNVEFRLGEIEHLPIADEIADIVVSNCVINLMPDKRPAFSEAFRVLKVGGRLVISDIVGEGPLPNEARTIEAWTACLAGAMPRADYLATIKEAGFINVEVVSVQPYVIDGLSSVTVRAVKPAR